MPQTFYIEADEEIISVISRLRSSPDPENFFIFPKQSIVLESPINLRLFQREAEKLGKRIVIVSQEESRRELASKLGIPTQEYTAEMGSWRQPTQGETPVSSSQPQAPSKNVRPTSVRDIPAGEAPTYELGSSDYYATPPSSEITARNNTITATQSPTRTPQKPITTVSPQSPEQKLRIRNMTPGGMTSLNSVRTPTSTVGRSNERIVSGPPATGKPMAPRMGPQQITHSPQKSVTATPRPVPQPQTTSRAAAFFREPVPHKPGISSPQSTPVATKARKSETTSAPISPKKSSSWGAALAIALVLIVAIGAGAAALLLIPTAKITLIPYMIKRDVDLRLEGKTVLPIETEPTDILPVRTFEKSIVAKTSITASGKGTGGGQKARGTLTVSNFYSPDPQPLIATTRFESSDGKIFRLLDSVTIPGSTTENGTIKPGTLEVAVVADETGTTYNVPAGTFRIPGFKSGPKYTKFEVRSTKAMIGGSDEASTLPVVTKEDLTKGLADLRESARTIFLDSLKSDLDTDEEALLESLEITSETDLSLPVAGTTGESFEGTGTFTLRTFVLSRTTLYERLLGSLTDIPESIDLRVVTADLSFAEVLPKYSDGMITFRASGNMKLETTTDIDKLSGELSGKDEAGMLETIKTYPGIKRIDVTFSPNIPFSRIPADKDRLKIEVGPGE